MKTSNVPRIKTLDYQSGPGRSSFVADPFPRRGKHFSIVWKTRETFFHCVENMGLFFHSVENSFPRCGKLLPQLHAANIESCLSGLQAGLNEASSGCHPEPVEGSRLDPVGWPLGAG
jgi:hypothetical protein